VDVEVNGEAADPEDILEQPSIPARGPVAWLRNTNHHPNVIAAIRRARQALPGDPDFGDPLSTAGDSGAQAAARAADRLIRDRDAATREVGLATLQVWQALTERISGRPVNAEVTVVFTDLVGFSDWSLGAGDEATLRLLRMVAQVIEPPLLDAGGRIVKRMGDGMMATFREPATAVRATLTALEAVENLDVEGYTPRMRAGVHTGRPQRIGGDWLGVDVNIAARVMERATRGGLIVSGATLERISPDEWDALGVTAKRVRRQVFAPRQQGVPADLAMYRITMRPGGPGQESVEEDDEEVVQA
jgi:class 3 adenylate cyclase